MIIDHYTLYQWLNFQKKVNVVRNWILLAKLHPTFEHKDLKAVIETTGCASSRKHSRKLNSKFTANN